MDKEAGDSKRAVNVKIGQVLLGVDPRCHLHATQGLLKAILFY